MKNVVIILSCLFSILISAQQLPSTTLESGFSNPPNEAKARTWWHWISGNVSKSGITKDLEAMKSVGIQEAQLFNVHLGFPKGSVKYLSEEWLELFKYSAEEAKRLGLELAFHNSAGWSSSGGPWVTPKHAMQTIVYSETTIKGNKFFSNQIPKPSTKFDYYQDIAFLAFPKPKADLKIDDLDYKILSERIRNHLVPDDKEISEAAVIQKESIIDLTSKVSTSGFLEWDVPEGDWIILRIGHTPIGTQNRPAPQEGRGLEVDKMSKTAVDAYWEGGIQPIIDTLGDLIGTTVNNCLIDSYEVETTNWTTGFDTQFEILRGYDLTTYLPTLAGYYVESGEISERFLWDFRRTIGDLIAENYYAHFRDLCHKNGMKFSVEPYWGPFDNMQVGATGDIVMCEFWSGGYPFFDSPKFVSSIAHLNGSSIVGAESFTGIGGWNDHPAQLKSIGDSAWAEGITRFIFHTYVHQPWDVAPGLALSYHGTDFNRLNTWWDQSKAYMEYIARSQFMLQQGKSVADVLVFTGESSPNTAFLLPEIKKLGYDYDLIGSNKLSELVVENGKITNAVGGQYEVMLLPDSDWIKAETLHKIQELVDAGAHVIGKKPTKSPSLTNYPTNDGEIEKLTQYLWDKGLVHDSSIDDFFSKNDIPADFKLEGEDVSDISFIHRKTNNADIYFIANATKERRNLNVRFRVSGKQPELWNAETGNIKDVAVYRENEDGTTSVPLDLDMEEAVFVVFNKAITKTPHLISAAMQLDQPPVIPLSNIQIVKAEYGTFLQEGLVDITDKVAAQVKDNQLHFRATRHFCDCDPAMGYKKELRMEYQIGTTKHILYAEEREHISIDAANQELKVIKAVFGKFKPETKGVPQIYQVLDITDKIHQKINSGEFNILVDDQLIDGKSIEGSNTSLKISFTTNGEMQTRLIPIGKYVNLSRSLTKPELFFNKGAVQWTTPFSGKLTYTNSNGETKTKTVAEIPKPIELSTNWDVLFTSSSGKLKKVPFDKLISWSDVQDEDVAYFSGTAAYHKSFMLSKEQIKPDYKFELDLGSVAVIAEVHVNEKYVGTLWKAPFRIDVSDVLQPGKNTLNIRVTNLWPNKLIGDEKLPLDFERKGDKIKRLPDWLVTNTTRPTERTTFSSWKHWSKDDTLLPSGLLGPIELVVHKILTIDNE